MYLKTNHKKIEIKECNTFQERFKALKFIIEPISYGIVLPKRKIINTYWFCQRVDCIVCNKDYEIIKIYRKLKSEKLRFARKGYYVFFLPLGVSNNYKVGDILTIKK